MLSGWEVLKMYEHQVIESYLTASQVKGEATILKKLLPRPDLTSFLLYASL